MRVFYLAVTVLVILALGALEVLASRRAADEFESLPGAAVSAPWR